MTLTVFLLQASPVMVGFVPNFGDGAEVWTLPTEPRKLGVKVFPSWLIVAPAMNFPLTPNDPLIVLMSARGLASPASVNPVTVKGAVIFPPEKYV